MISIPRVARKDLNTLFFNIIVQGVNKEYIFYSEKYIKIINDNIKDYKITIIAYCIMNNHAHFFIKLCLMQMGCVPFGIYTTGTKSTIEMDLQM